MLLALLCALTLSLPAIAADRVTIFAASSLAVVVEEILEQAPTRVVTSFAGTSTLARQIEAGAPADIFISANEHWADTLELMGLLEPGTRRAFAANTLVLVSPANSSLPDLSPWHLLQHPSVQRVAIGETGSVPAGIYGREVLEHLELWDTVKPKLLPADNVRNVMAWVERGEADLAFVYRSDALTSKRVTVRSLFRPSKINDLTPVSYTAAIIRGKDNGSVRAVFDAFFSSEAQSVLTAHGFRSAS
jgi:molybdate transport system substrate-binding protein